MNYVVGEFPWGITIDSLHMLLWYALWLDS